MPAQLLASFVLSLVIVLLAYRHGSLSLSGAGGALAVGTLILGLGGWVWGTLLGLFFVSSSLLSRFKESEKEAAAEKFAKGSRRDLSQVLANGGPGAIVAILNAILPAPPWFPLFTGIMATVTADTWATELGTLSRKPPRLITTGTVVSAGTSGGVSPLGTFVSLLGGLLIGLVAALLSDPTRPELAVVGAGAGLAGSSFDSLLGATIQRINFCDVCQKDTERTRHRCGHATRPLRGWAWLNNDVVNLLASIAGGLTAVAASWLLSGVP